MHDECREWIRKLGPFYGTLTFLIRKNHQLPPISEFLGQTSGTVTVCSVCNSIIHGNERGIEKHYKKTNHVFRKNDRAFKVRIFERPAQGTVLETHFDSLMSKDKRLLNELMERAQHVIMHEEEKELTQEEQEKEEETSRIRHERISEETNRRIEEAERRRLEIARNGSIVSTESTQEREITQPQEGNP